MQRTVSHFIVLGDSFFSGHLRLLSRTPMTNYSLKYSWKGKHWYIFGYRNWPVLQLIQK